MARSKTRQGDGDAAKTITRDDLEQKLRSLQDGFKGKVEEQKSTILAVVGTVAAVVVVAVFLLGRRSGKKKTTLVEIRRV